MITCYVDFILFNIQPRVLKFPEFIFGKIKNSRIYEY